MKTLDFSLNSQKNGGKITALTYSHSLNELVGSWSASVAGGTFKAGNSISFSGVMTSGIITRAYKDSEGLWLIEGKDAGIKLMKSTPDISDLPSGSAKAVIQYLAQFCGISLSMSPNGLSGFNVRSIISGSTCAEAVLELAMVSGLIAYVNNNGVLVIATPSRNNPHFSDIINDSGSDIDLDGYATQVIVTLNRRKWPDNSQSDDDNDSETVYTGTTPSTSPERVTRSGTFSNGSYSITTLEPFGVVARSQTSITDNGITISTVEEHTYDYRSKIIWRDNQEYVLFAFIEKGYTLTRSAQGQFNGSIEYNNASGIHVVDINPSFSETTTETMTRTMSASDAVIGVPEDWQGDIKLVASDTITRSSSRTGFIPPAENMPPYAPPFDSQVTRTYIRENGGRGLLCNETEATYEARQIGSIAPVTLNGQNIPHFIQGTNLAIQTHSTPQWVLIKNYRTYYEQYDNDGQCILSTSSEYSDDGSQWLLEGNNSNIDAYQAAYSAFSQNSKGLKVSIGSSVLSSEWHFLELQGRMRSKVTSSDIETAIGNISEWYDNGQYVRQSVCPHYNIYTKSCNVYMLDNSSSQGCNRSKGTRQWLWCTRALAALALAKEQDTSQVDVPVIGVASSGASSVKNPPAGYQRDIYVDELITDEQAQSIADTIASNILTVKGIKGLRKTVTVPYSSNFQPNGTILEVSHNWENLQTSITYREQGDIPECLISQSVAGIAAFVSARENSRLNVPKYGVVLEVSGGYISVKVGNSTVSCTTKLNNLAQNDIVLVAFPAGNKLRGQVIARL